MINKGGGGSIRMHTEDKICLPFKEKTVSDTHSCKQAFWYSNMSIIV